MKITGARNEPFSAMRRRALAQAGAQVRSSTPVDSTEFLGIAEVEMTPSVKAAIQTLMGEIDDLRGEVGRLKGRLAETEELADRDALTPLLNRRAFVRELGRIRTFAQRYGLPASLVYIDLDDLKGVNDRLGHAAGDAALKAVAERLVSQLRESDIVGRMGGDEFAVILAQADHATAEAKAAALARAIEAEPLRFGEWSAPLHISWGVREITQDAEPEGLVADADAAMFARKRGRKSA
ncbi:MAG TPA: GGDEF domain-containing protein [Phenylobacterium sp.]|jgi:diguanylate cyclase (GGDEF)-like protein|uniref:GGDEF domain-containing protein n=1 Tax=Phenylobacterium sp. TaxID=1871053 RepID=UPI002D07B5AF|nr:GGDEF domain-containing protein [Phenylobacterium sp.]HXA37784.1 GGDEF domain-containing protein [Phenylobacterium sp.]